MSGIFAFGDLKISFRAEPITITSRGHHVSDPDWVRVDEHGHRHRFVDGELPTLEWIATETYWCETCCDEHEEGEWRCRQCGAVVEPHYHFTGPQTTVIRGLQEIEVSLVDGLTQRRWHLNGDESRELSEAVPGDRHREELERRTRAIVARRDPDAWSTTP